MRGATSGAESVRAASRTAAGIGGALAKLVPEVMFTATKIIDFSDLINDVNMFPYAHWV